MANNYKKCVEIIKMIIESHGYKFKEAMQPHPIFPSFATQDMETREMVHITPDNIEKLKKQWYDMFDKMAREKDIWKIMMMLHKPYRLQILLYIYNHLDGDTFTELLKNNWMSTEFPHQNGIRPMIDAFKKTNKDKLMDKEELEFYNNLPETIVCYRGLQAPKAPIRGLSWTLDKKKAKWFARRWSQKNKLYQAKINKKHIFAYFNDRDEEEVVLNPLYLKELKLTNDNQRIN